ncbi:hypothetical protein HQ533_01280 [Candidatus Woesearchaeota archaeon]|nr:hypothetical protein [Candidatus Woesearchaeota archaeon]
MKTQLESVFSYFLAAFFVVGTSLFFVIFSEQSKPNFYPLTIFLLGILIITLFYNKLDFLEFSKTSLKLQLLQASIKKQKTDFNQYELLKEKYSREYDTQLDIKEGI